MTDTPIRIPSESQLLAHVREYPKRRAAEIADAFGLAPAFLRPLLRGLVGRGVIFVEGRTQGARYWIPSAKERREAATSRPRKAAR